MTTISALLFEVDGTVKTVDLDNRSLRQFQEFVGGYIESISGPDWVAYVNEEGKMKNLPLNEKADRFVHTHGWRGVSFGPFSDYLVGPVLLVGPRDEEGYDTSVHKSLIDWASAWL